MSGGGGSGRPLGVAQFIETMDVGGAEHLAVKVAGALAARGHASHLIVATGPGPLSPRIDPAVRTHYLGFVRASVRNPPAFAWSVSRGLRHLGGVIRSEGLEVIQTHLPGANFWGLALSLRGTCGVVATVHNNEEFRYGDHDSRLLRAARRAAYGQIVRRCGVVAVSAAVKESLARQLRLGEALAARIAVVPNAVPQPAALAAADRALVRERWGVAPGEVLLLAAGRFTAQKNFGDLVEVAGRLAAAGVAFRLVIAGDGEERPALQARAAAAGLADRVLMPGNLADLDRVMGAADVFVMSSLWEGLPLVLLEAMAAGLPVAAYAIDGVREVVSDGASGLTVPAGDAGALADALAALARDPGLRQRLGTGAGAVVRERYSFDALVDRLEACYRQAAGV
ncbi:MAG: glycosyltransferase family 4 protein [Candidatus Krumholzibacteriia bacterium]